MAASCACSPARSPTMWQPTMVWTSRSTISLQNPVGRPSMIGRSRESNRGVTDGDPKAGKASGFPDQPRGVGQRPDWDRPVVSGHPAERITRDECGAGSEPGGPQRGDQPGRPGADDRDIEAVMAPRRHHSSVAREVDNAEAVKPVECELDGKRGQKEPEDLFGHEHPAGVEVVAHSVRPPKHDHVKSDYHQEHP